MSETINLGIEVGPASTVDLGIEVDDTVSVSAAEAWAVGQRGGVDVDSSDPTYHNNARYWASQAQGEPQVVGTTLYLMSSPST